MVALSIFALDVVRPKDLCGSSRFRKLIMEFILETKAATLRT
jgi:hypothetical protein